MISEKEQKVYEVLDDLHIPYEKFEHIPVFTVDEVKYLGLDFGAAGCKNLFLRNRKGDKHYLVIIQEEKKVDLKQLSKSTGSSGLSFASEERLEQHLGLTRGSVTPFGLINDNNGEIEVLIDQDLASTDFITFHPNVNTATIRLSYEDFKRFLDWCGNPVSYIRV